MKFENFQLVKVEGQQIIEINYLEKIFDLHNAAEFAKIEYQVNLRSLIISWNYYPEYGKDSVTPVSLHFIRTNEFEISPRDIQMPYSEDDCLQEIISGDKLKFKFTSGIQITVAAESVYFQEGL